MIIGIDGNEANQESRVGIGQFAFNVIKEIERIDKKNEYIVYLKQTPLPDLPLERPSFKYKVFGPGKLWTQIALPIKLFTQKENIDLFFSPSHYSPRFSPVPTIISIMDLWHHRHPEQFAKKDLYQLTRWEKYSVKKAVHIITISEFSKSEIIKIYNYPEEKITVAYPGYEKCQMSNVKCQMDKIEEKYKINGEYLLYLGTLQPKKNLLHLIEAFNILISLYPNITLVLAGKKGWLYEEIFEKVKNLNLEKRVIFTDFIEERDKPYLISGAKCFVLPSFYEGFGIPVLEALSLGVPVAISNTSSLPEVGGKAAFYFNPEKPYEIAETLASVLKLSSSELEKVKIEGKKQAEKFSWEKCARKILETFGKLEIRN